LRLQALDYLASGHLSAERLDRVIGRLSPERDTALLVRAERSRDEEVAQ
jgi:hypothetical protein